MGFTVHASALHPPTPMSGYLFAGSRRVLFAVKANASVQRQFRHVTLSYHPEKMITPIFPLSLCPGFALNEKHSRHFGMLLTSRHYAFSCHDTTIMM
jgi:hypothetical protein